MSRRLLLYPAFLLSGAFGLAYEVIWVRQLSLLLGNTTEAVATVLAAFMLGLSIGSTVAGRIADRVGRPLRFYAAVEVAIGGVALVATWLLDSLGPTYRALARELGEHTALFPVVRFVFAFATVSVPAALMGATLPVLARTLLGGGSDSAGSPRVGGEVGRLYAINTLGAAIGCYTAGFWALGHLGLVHTARFAAAGNVAVGLVVLALGGGAPARGGAHDPTAKPDPVTGAREGESLAAVWLAVVTSGFVGLALEGIWTRILQFSIGASAYAFSLMLTIFLLGLALGGLVVSRTADRIRQPLRALGGLTLALGVAVAVSLAGFVPFAGTVGGLVAARFSSFWLVSWLIGFALMGAPTLVLGMIFPLGSRLAAASAARVGRDVGGLYALNTVGSIAGSLVAAFVAIPWLGTEVSLLALALISSMVGVLLLTTGPIGKRLAACAALLVVGGFAIGAIEGKRATFLMPLFRGVRGEGESVDPVFFREGRTSTVSVHRYERFRNEGALKLYTNGSSMTGTFFDGKRYMKLLGHLPVLLAHAPERVLTICFGTGMTFGATALHPGVKESICAELSSAVLEAAPLFADANDHVLSRGNARVVIGDGRQVLLSSVQPFDVITAEPPPPRQAGTYQLYSREFYELARERLGSNGILAQWLPLHDQSELEVRMLVRTFLDVFPNASLWLPHAAEGILLGSPSPMAIDPETLAARMAAPEVRDSLSSIGVTSPAALLGTFVMGREDLGRYARFAPALTDDRPFSDFFEGLPPPMETALIERLLAYASPLESLGLTGAGLRAPALAAMPELWSAHRAYLEGVVHNVRDRIFEAHQRAPENGFYSDTLSISPWQLAALERDLADRPSEVGLYFDRARVAINGRDYDTAVRFLERVTRGAPTLAMGWFNLGWALELAGRSSDARAAYSKSSELDRSLGEQVAARLETLTVLAPDASNRAPGSATNRRLVMQLAEEGRIATAIEVAERDASEHPEEPAAAVTLTELLIRAGRHRDADQVVRSGLERFSGSPDLVTLEARNALSLGRFDDVLTLLAPVTATDSTQRFAGERCFLRGQALRELARWDEASAAYACASAAGLPANELAEGLAAIAAARKR